MLSVLKDSDDNDIFDTNIIFYNDKTIPDEEVKHSSSSETEFFDTIDSLHGNFGDIQNDLNKPDDDSTVLTACLDNRVDSHTVNSSTLTKTTTTLTIEQNSLEEAKDDKNPTKDILIHTAETNSGLESDRYENKEELYLLHITKDVSSFSGFIQDLIDKKIEKYEDAPDNTPQLSPITTKPPVKPKRSDKYEDAIENTAKYDQRGGKYNKKTAPLPPKNNQSPAIKATLVLQPGVVRNLLPEGDTNCKEIFCHSPKSKRRNFVNRSQSLSSASSSRTKQSLSKLIKFPKKIGFWNRDEHIEKKLHEDGFPRTNLLKPLSDSKLQSKSENNLIETERDVNVPLHGTNLSKSGSLLSLRSLTESPLAHRRLKIIRRFVDDDID